MVEQQDKEGKDLEERLGLAYLVQYKKEMEPDALRQMVCTLGSHIRQELKDEQLPVVIHCCSTYLPEPRPYVEERVRGYCREPDEVIRRPRPEEEMEKARKAREAEMKRMREERMVVAWTLKDVLQRATIGGDIGYLDGCTLVDWLPTFMRDHIPILVDDGGVFTRGCGDDSCPGGTGMLGRRMQYGYIVVRMPVRKKD
jgi:hypothetical protein